MAKTSVLLLGATGETGGDILNGLIEDGSFDITALVQPSSANKPAVLAFANKDIKIVIADISGSIEDLATALKGYEIVISAIGGSQQLLQLSLVDAAALAGVKRFVPCGFITVCPPSGIMNIRDDKEVVYQRIWYHKLPFTIIDVGYWHQISWPRLASGKVDYAVLLPKNEVYGDGNAPTLLTDKRDIGRFVARIVKDPRTLNQKVFTWSDEISQNDIIKLFEKKAGEKIEYETVSANDLLKRRDDTREAYKADPGQYVNAVMMFQAEYSVSKYIRVDNTRENAKYLGYLDARELYPDFEPIKFESFLDELLDGKAESLYKERFAAMMEKK